jgi:hypothetical protein
MTDEISNGYARKPTELSKNLEKNVFSISIRDENQRIKRTSFSFRIGQVDVNRKKDKPLLKCQLDSNIVCNMLFPKEKGSVCTSLSMNQTFDIKSWYSYIHGNEI